MVSKAIFIDGSFLFHHVQTLNTRIDYKKLKSVLTSPDDHVAGVTFYSAMPSDADIDDRHRSFLRIVRREARIRVKTVPLIKSSTTSERRVKGEDILLACEMVRGALLNHYDVAVLVSGDGDFVPAVNMVQDSGKQVVVAAFRSSFSHTLDQEANEVIYLDDYLEQIKLT